MPTPSVLVFNPLYMDRVWGGREMETRYGRPLPAGPPVGEAWELVDREDAQSVVADGPLAGLTLHDLWTGRREEIFGARCRHQSGRFPLLIKLLDARDRLSVQVHPPLDRAAELGGEPKTEMWYFLHCDPGARIYAGLRRGTTGESFGRLLQEGRVEECLHVLPTRTGDSIFIPSGRLHAIGEGNLIVEVQQNSDTTYRVFDWNRCGLDGQPRTLHLEQSLASVDFGDFEPPLDHVPLGVLAECPFFRVEKLALSGPVEAVPAGQFAVFACVEGRVACGGREFGPADFFLVPAAAAVRTLEPVGPEAAVLRAVLP